MHREMSRLAHIIFESLGEKGGDSHIMLLPKADTSAEIERPKDADKRVGRPS